MQKRLNSPLLLVENLSVAFGSGKEILPVLRDVEVEVGRGEFIAIIGPSGCGKTTFFNVLAGLNRAGNGRMFLEGRPVPHLRGQVAYMQQKDLLLPWRNTIDNVILGMEIQGVDKRSARQEARQLLKVFGLEGFEASYPDELSGGMRQRVALMRTIQCHKNIWLLDEPFGALDAITRRELQKWLLEIWDRFGASVLLVTHDVEEALILADRIYVMTARPAMVKASVAVPLARPRRITQPEMVNLKENLLGLLENEVAL